MTHSVDDRVNFVVAKCGGLLCRFQLRGQCEIIKRPAKRVHDNFHCRTLPRAGVANVNALTLEVGKRGDSGVRAGDDRKWLTVHRENCAFFIELVAVEF